MKTTLKKDEFIFRQNENFDSHDELNRSRVRLCNVKAEVFNNVKKNDLCKIDFDGDNCVIWNGVVTSKNPQNHTVCIYLP